MSPRILLAAIGMLCGMSQVHAQAVPEVGLQLHLVPRVASSFGPQHHDLGWAYGLQFEVTSGAAGFFVEGNQWIRREEICLDHPLRYEAVAALLGAWCDSGPPLARSFEGGLAVHPLPGASQQPFLGASIGAVRREDDRTQTMVGFRGGVDLPTLSFVRFRLEFTHHRTVSAPLGEQIWFSTLSVGLRFSHRFGL